MRGDDGIDDDSFTAGEGLDVPGLLGLLLSEKRGDVGFETTGAHTHDDQTKGEDTDGGLWVDDDGWSGGRNEDEMADKGENEGILNGLQTAEVSICHISTDKRHNVCPE